MKNIALSLVAILALNTSLVAKDDKVNLDTMTVTSESLGYADVDSSKISLKQASLLSEVFRDIPGVYVGGTNGFNQKFFMRGVNDRAVNITIDGAKQKGNTFHHNADLLLDPELLKAAEVSVGVNSVTQGSGALGGSVAFKTIDASDMLEDGEVFGGKIKTGYASNNENWSQSLTLYGKVFDTVELLGYISNHSHKFGKSGDGYRVGGDGSDFSSLLKATFKISDNQKLTLSYNRMKYDGLYPFRAEFGSVPKLNEKTGLMESQALEDQDYKRDTYVLDYDLKQNDYLNLNLNLYKTEHKLIKQDWDSGFETTGGKLQNGSKLNFGSLENALNYGIEYYKIENNTKHKTRPGNDNESANSLTLFLEDQIKFGGFKLTPGVKYDKAELDSMNLENKKYTHDFDEFTYSLTAEYNFEFGLGLFAGYTELFRAPDPIEPIRIWNMYNKYQANPDLKPETGNNKEIGINFVKAVSDSTTLRFLAKYFETELENMISETYSETKGGISSRQNVGNATTDGVEIVVGAYINDLSLSASYSKAETDYKQLQKLDKTSNIIGRDSGDKYTFNAEYYLHSIGVIAGWNSLFVEKLTTATETKPSYSVHDIYATWSPNSGKLKGLELNLGVYNLFDKEYVSHTSRSTVSTYRDPEPGRNIKATISYKF